MPRLTPELAPNVTLKGHRALLLSGYWNHKFNDRRMSEWLNFSCMYCNIEYANLTE